MNTSLLKEEQQPSYAAANSLLGVDYDRIDPYTCRVIHTLFPPHTCGFAFFAGLLRNAIVKQCALPDNLADVRRDAAVVSIKGYAELSQRLGLSYDTTHMYLVVYHALGLLYIERQAKQTEIIIPLHLYRPPARLAETLWQLQKHYRTKRPRVRRLVNNVIERLATLVQTESEQKCYERSTLLQPDQPPFHTEILTRVQQVLAIKDIEDPDGQIATSIIRAVTPFIVTHIEALSPTQDQQELHAYFSQICPENQQGETTEPQESSSSRRQEQIEKRPVRVNLPTTLSREAGLQGSICRKTGQPRADGRFSAQNLPTLLSKKGSTHGNSLQKPTHSVACGRFNAKNLHAPQQTGEVSENIFADDGRFLASNLPANHQAGYASQAAPEPMRKNLPIKVESSIMLLNGNGNGNGENTINILSLSVDTDSVPVLPVRADGKRQRSPMSRRFTHTTLINQARSLARLIEGNEENVGAYITLIQQHHPRTLRAAVIATLLRKHWPQGRGVLRKPGGYYTRRVQQFQHAIPEPILSLLQTYGQVSYEEIDVALGTQAQMQAARHEPGTSVRQGTIRLKRGMPMSKATAEVLALRIPLEDSSVQVRGVYEEEGIYAVRVYIAPVEHLFASIEDWECYHAQMQLLEQEESA